MQVEFFFDVVCPFAHLAATRVEGVAREAGATVAWRPILLGGLLKEHGADPDPNGAMPEAKRRLSRLDLGRQATLMGEIVRFPAEHPRRTVGAMRLLTAAPAEAVPALARDLYRAYWVDGEDVGDRAVLARIGSAHGLEPAVLDDPQVKDQLRSATADAARRGVFGVPTFIVGGERLWGVDRLPFVRRALGLPPDPPIAVPMARGRSLLFVHDVASPFSYLASTQVERLASEAFADLVALPILVGALFRDLSTPMVPLHTYSAAKQSWVSEDLQRWAAHHGVPFRFPTEFPIRSLVAQRVAVVEPAVVPALYRAAWVDDRPISDPLALRVVLDEAGFDGETLLALADTPPVKDALRANTERAKALGACGVPSFLVDGRHLFWGQDRMDQVSLALRGWDPPSG